MIKRLELRNFTVFKDLSLDFSPKINVIIGENGTGKTHLLKAAYALCSGADWYKSQPELSDDELRVKLTNKLIRLFMPLEEKLGRIVSRNSKEQTSLSALFSFDEKVTFSFRSNSQKAKLEENHNYNQYLSESVFIPTKEVLSLAKGMTDATHDQQTVDLIFDDGYVDLAKALLCPGNGDPESKIDIDPRFGTIVPKLVRLVGGRYIWENGGFSFQPGEYTEISNPEHSKSNTAQMYQDSTITQFVPAITPKFSSSMTAEGFRKIGILHRLLCNGTISSGVSGPLFWDEPESNMNPKLMQEIVEVLLELSRNGQQLILATHDYVFLKWFDLLINKRKGDHVLYHALHSTDGVIDIESAESYQELNMNSIADTFGELYDKEIQRALVGGLDQ